MPNSIPSGSIYRTVFLAILFLFISYNFALNFARAGGHYFILQDYLSGQAPLPNQFRILMMPVFKFLLSLLDEFNPPNYFSKLPEYLIEREQLAYAIVNCVGLFCALIFFIKSHGPHLNHRFICSGPTSCLSLRPIRSSC